MGEEGSSGDKLSSAAGFVGDIAKRFGLAGVAVVMVFVAGICGVTHFLAAPGTQVSLLGGIAKYTKAGGETPEATLSARSPEEELKRWRSTLRPLAPMEDGLPLAKIPTGTYFFAYVTGVEGLLNSPTIYTGSRVPGPSYIELHYLAKDDLEVVGYSDAPSAAKVAADTAATVFLLAKATNDFQSLLRINLYKAKKIDSRIFHVTDDEISIGIDVDFDRTPAPAAVAPVEASARHARKR